MKRNDNKKPEKPVSQSGFIETFWLQYARY